MTVQTTTKVDQAQDDRQRPEPTNLTRRYGKIGIRALVAALRYATSTKNQVSAPAITSLDERFLERAA